MLKQMKLIHTAGFDAAERENYRVIVFNNVYNIMETLLEILDHEGITLEDTSLEVRRGIYKECFYYVKPKF